MNLVDLLVLMVVLAFSVRGYRRGLVQEGLETAAAVGALLLSVRMFSPMATLTTVYTGIPQSVTGPVLFVALAVSIASIGFGLASLIRRAIAARPIWERTDGWVGLGFGAFKGALISAILLVLVSQAPYATIVAALEASAAGRAVYALMPEVYRHVDVWLKPQ